MIRVLVGLWRRVWRPRRALFSFRSDGATQYRDPGVVRRRLAELNPRWGDLLDRVVAAARPLPPGLGVPPHLAAAREREGEAATVELADLVGRAFGVAPLGPDGRGMTEGEMIDLLADYLHCCSDLMRAHRPLPSAPPATASAGGA